MIAVWNQLKKQDQDKPYGINNQILTYSSVQPLIGNLVQLDDSNAQVNRSCDINDFYKSQICLFTNIVGIDNIEASKQLKESKCHLIIKYQEYEQILVIQQGIIEEQLESVGKTKNVNKQLDNIQQLFRQSRKSYKDQLDLLGKIQSVQHPPVIEVQIVFQQPQVQLETPYISRKHNQKESEFIGYYNYDQPPFQIIETYIKQLQQTLATQLPQVYYYNEQSLLPIPLQDNSIKYKSDSKQCRRFLVYKQRFNKVVFDIGGKIMNPHHFLSPKGIENGQKYLVRGDYVYHHYMQNGYDDKGWGCAYRSFMTVLSWLIENGYTKQQSIPQHKQIQQLLVEMGDKPIDFVGTQEWIGAFEVSMLITKLTTIDCRILNIQKGSDILQNLNVFKEYFNNHGCPIMFGGGLYAYTLLGIDVSDDDCRFLILDPHYIASDNIKTIIEKGGIQWKKADMFDDANFYNFCMPLVE